MHIMRDPEERTRHFVIREKRDADYDEPAVRRRKPMAGEEESRRGALPAEDVGKSAYSALFSRRDLRKRELEDEEDIRNPRTKTAKTDDYDDYDDGNDECRKAPILVRIFAWFALLAVLFAIGYLGTNYFFSWADKKGGPRLGSVYGSGAEVEQSQPAGGGAPSASGSEAYTLYIPDNGKFTERKVDINKGLPEEDIEKVLAVYIDGLKETNMLDNGVYVKNIFRSGDWLYLDMTGAFQSSLKKIGKDKAALVITGLVKTMQENFPPIKKVKFYIEGKESNDKSTVDLTKPWEITQ